MNILLRCRSLLPSSALRLSARWMFIQVQETPNPSTYKFLPGQEVMGKGRGTLNFDSIKAAKQSPLAMQLMLVNGVKNVFFGEDYVSVTKASETEEWAVLKPEIFAVLMDYMQSEKPIVNEGEMPDGPKDTEIKPEDDETVVMIKELIECRVKPMVQEDGGDIVYRGFRDGIVYLKLQGSCTGCPSSSVTLQAGIKNMLQFYVPDVVDVVEEMDEADILSNKAFDDLENIIKTKPAKGI